MKHRTRKPSRSDDQQTVTVGTKSWDALWSAYAPAPVTLAEELEAQGYKSIRQLAAFWDISETSAEERVKKFMAARKFECVRGRNGATRVWAKYYRPIANAA